MFLLIELIATFIESFFLFGFLYMMFDPRKKLAKHNLVVLLLFSLLLSVFVTVYAKIIPQENLISTAICVLIMWMYSLVFLKGNGLVKLFACVVAEAVLICVALFTAFILMAISSQAVSEVVLQTGFERTVTLFFNKLVLLLVLTMIVFIMRGRKLELKRNEQIAVLLVFSSTLICGICIYEGPLNGHSELSALFYLLTAVSLVAINIIFFVMMMIISKENKRQLSVRLLEVQLREHEASLQNAENYYKEIKKIKHDIRGNYSSISRLIDAGEIDEAKDYLHQLEGSFPKTTYIYDSGSPVLDAIISHNLSFAVASGNELQLAITAANTDEFESADISVLLTNLITNAVEATKDAENKIIKLTISEHLGLLNIIVSNSVKENVVALNPELLTTKEDKDEHGFGIASIRSIADKYHGTAKFSVEEGKFVADIMLTPPKTRKK